ncbi:response regulator [Magnetospirillum sulfuroxidans]|uniref:Response regulator n=1 Tax=Magnetospirillum sulfuroxidans TaxID=611300 RepID=A0ABS5ICC6_9PROT|nr:response regulator [Magnetospirillum sulfuroxidans]MBR9972080.1 response regulator [Magnetospirillum sulfuroxidans]
MLSRTFVHDANQCLHVIRLAAESLALEHGDGKLTDERLNKRIGTILGQVDQLTQLIGHTTSSTPSILPRSDNVTMVGAPLILLADDEVLAAMMLADHLQQRGYDVHVAHDGQEAFELCHNNVYDAVITDIRMPRMDGMELIRRLEELQPGTPIIVASGHIRGAEAEHLPDSVVKLVGKPFSLPQISDALAKTLAAPLGSRG